VFCLRISAMGGASSWLAMLSIAGFFVSVWLASRFSKLLRVSSIVLEVAVGLVLGPSVLKLIPGELSQSNAFHTIQCEASSETQLKYAQKGPDYCDLGAYVEAGKYHDFLSDDETLYESIMAMEAGPMCGGGSGASGASSGGSTGARLLASKSNAGEVHNEDYETCLTEACALDRSIAAATFPDIFSLAGHIGVAMMIFESGMHFDFEQAKKVGPWASAVAVLGTFLPILGGTALSMAFGFPLMEGLAAGVSLAPTSVGIALKLLHEANALGLYFGQAVMTGAFVDDVLSLIIFNVLFSVGPCMSFATFIPTICGIVFMIAAIIFATKGFPSLIKLMLSNIPETKPDAKVTRHDEVMFMLMFATLVAYAHITYMCGTHLWGCFIAGMSFASETRSHHIWVKQVKRNTVWFLRMFFACTLAWSIPVDALFSLDAFLKGTLMGIGPCILTKVCCAPFMGDAKWVIGWAMVGRAEFAYFIAIMANSQKLMSDDLFAILVWALIYATVFAPLVFRKVLANYMSKLNNGKPEAVKRPALAHCVTGHLPDLLYAEHDQDSKLQQRVKELELALESKAVEIGELKTGRQLSVCPADAMSKGSDTPTSFAETREGSGTLPDLERAISEN